MRNLKLRLAIALVLFLSFLIPVIFATLMTLIDQKQIMTQELEKEHTRILDILALSMQEPLWNLVPETGLPLMNAFMSDTRIVSIKVLSDEGPFIEKLAETKTSSANLLTREKTILYYGKEIGNVTVTIDTSQLEQTIAIQSSRYMAIILIPFLLSTIVLFLLLRRKIIKPIDILISQSKKLAKKQLDEEFHWHQEDEIGLLGQSLEMTRRALQAVFIDLEKSKNQAIIYSRELETGNLRLKNEITERTKAERNLLHHKEQLEETIQQRTSELLQANENLIREMEERRKIEDERRIIEIKLHQSEKMEALGLLASGVAHDLNNILSGIVSYPEILLHNMDKLNPLYKPLETINGAGKRAAAVVSDLLTISRNAATVRAPNNLNDLVQEYFASPEFLQLRAISDKVHLRFYLDATQPYILCSPVHVKKCLMNLVTNSVEAIGKDNTGTISITTYNMPNTTESDISEETSEYVVVSIQDDGHGINEKDLDHVFEPFYSTKQMGKSGSGLGLAVVWNALQEHNGKVAVSSNSDGTCFRLYFPKAEVQEMVAVPKNEEGHAYGDNKTVLVIDDEPLLLTIAEKMLTELSFRVTTVPSGEKALEFIEHNTVDLVMLDMVMAPGINGRQTYEQILRTHPGQKAFIVSGFAMNDDIQAALDMGVTAVLKKPYTIKELSDTVLLTLGQTKE